MVKQLCIPHTDALLRIFPISNPNQRETIYDLFDLRVLICYSTSFHIISCNTITLKELSVRLDTFVIFICQDCFPISLNLKPHDNNSNTWSHDYMWVHTRHLCILSHLQGATGIHDDRDVTRQRSKGDTSPWEQKWRVRVKVSLRLRWLETLLQHWALWNKVCAIHIVNPLSFRSISANLEFFLQSLERVEIKLKFTCTLTLAHGPNYCEDNLLCREYVLYYQQH